jgi:hypothetical protein
MNRKKVAEMIFFRMRRFLQAQEPGHETQDASFKTSRSPFFSCGIKIDVFYYCNQKRETQRAQDQRILCNQDNEPDQIATGNEYFYFGQLPSK